MLFSVVILSFVEGITEFLPISSTGHLLLLSELLNLDKSFYEVFDISIQMGAILAVLSIYPNYFKSLIMKPFDVLNQKLVITMCPILMLGFLTKDFIKGVLFQPQFILSGLFIGGVGLIIVEKLVPYKIKQTDNKTNVTFRQAIIIGLWQCLALWPGMSRSAATIVGGISAGLNRVSATSFSFVIAVPLICIISIYDIISSSNQLVLSDFGWIGLGMLISYFVAIITMKWFLKFVKSKGLLVFGVYRIIISIVGYAVFL